LSLGVLDRNTRCVRDPVDSIESRNNGCRIDERGVAHCRTDFALRLGKPFIVSFERGLRECDKQAAMGNIAISRRTDNQAQIEGLTVDFAALTEQVDM